jgi:hypothetical protein
MSASVSLGQSGEADVHTFVGEIVAKAENKLRWLFTVLQNKPLCNLALVDKPRADFEVGFAGHDLDVVLLCNGPL